MNTIDKSCITIIVIIIISCGFVTYNLSTPYKTEMYIITVSELTSDSITNENGNVLFIHNIQNFNWTLGTTYEITTNSYPFIYQFIPIGNKYVEITNIRKKP